MRFGQAEATDGPAGGELFQPGVFLLIGPVIEDRTAAHRAVNAHQRASGGVGGGDFLNCQRIGNVVDVGAAPLLRDHHAQQPQLAEFGNQRVVDPASFFPGLGMWSYFIAGKVARHVANHYLLFGQFKIVHDSILQTAEETLHMRGTDVLRAGMFPLRLLVFIDDQGANALDQVAALKPLTVQVQLHGKTGRQ